MINENVQSVDIHDRDNEELLVLEMGDESPRAMHIKMLVDIMGGRQLSQELCDAVMSEAVRNHEGLMDGIRLWSDAGNRTVDNSWYMHNMAVAMSFSYGSEYVTDTESRYKQLMSLAYGCCAC